MTDGRYTTESAFRQSSDVVFRDVGGETILLDSRRGTYFALNEVGAAAWQLIDGGVRLQEVCAGLVERYEVTSETAWTDLVELVEELERHGLVEIATA